MCVMGTSRIARTEGIETAIELPKKKGRKIIQKSHRNDAARRIHAIAKWCSFEMILRPLGGGHGHYGTRALTFRLWQVRSSRIQVHAMLSSPVLKPKMQPLVSRVYQVTDTSL